MKMLKIHHVLIDKCNYRMYYIIQNTKDTGINTIDKLNEGNEN